MTQERLKEIIGLISQPGFRLVFARSGGSICGPEIDVLSEEINYLGQTGWLKSMPSGCGAWLSDEGRKAFMGSTDERGDGRLVMPDESRQFAN